MKSSHAWCARWLVCFFAGIALAALAQSDSMDTFAGKPDSKGFILIPPDSGDWTRHFRIGAMVGMNIKANFKTKGTFNISGNNPAKVIYDDGYVRVDDTGNAGGLCWARMTRPAPVPSAAPPDRSAVG